MSTFINKKLVFILFLTFFYIGCKSKKEESKIVKIKEVNIILETSGSMLGYFNGNQGASKFKKDIFGIITKIDRLKNVDTNITKLKIEEINANLVDNNHNIIKYKTNLSEFINDINTNAPTVFIGKDTQLDKIFKSVIEKTDTNSISILISDCIVSTAVPNRTTLNELESIMSNITLTLNNYIQKNLSIIFLKYTSEYTGTYYTAKNKTFNLTDFERPYYIVLVGQQNYLEHFYNELKKMGLSNYDELYLGFDNKQTYKLLTYTSAQYKAGKFTIKRDDDGNDAYSEKVVIKDKNKPITFSLVLDLKKLSRYQQNIGFLQNNIIVEGSDNNRIEWEIEKLDDVKDKIHPNDYKNLGKSEFFNSYSHIMTIRLNKISSIPYYIKIRLDENADDWYKTESTLDDDNINNLSNKNTFAFKYLVEAIRRSLTKINTINIKIKVED